VHAIMRHKRRNHRDREGPGTSYSVKVSVAVNSCMDIPVCAKVVDYGVTVQLSGDVDIRDGRFDKRTCKSGSSASAGRERAHIRKRTSHRGRRVGVVV
jgi:hypothetical protein